MDLDIEKGFTAVGKPIVGQSTSEGKSITRSDSIRASARSERSLDGSQIPRRSSSTSPSAGSSAAAWTLEQARNVRLNPADAGHWAINHHLSGLVAQIAPPKSTFSSRLLQSIANIFHGDDQAHQQDVASGNENERRFRISFAEMQRMRLRKLQCTLVRQAMHMRTHGTEPDDWERTLEQYVKAVQDYDFMERRSRSLRDPFLASGEYNVDQYVLRNTRPSSFLRQEFPEVPSRGKWEGANASMEIVGVRSENRRKTQAMAFQQRVSLAVVGGVFLIGPMWLMVLRNDLKTALISTTIFVAAFGIIMAFYLESGQGVLAATAAYAAVLVVFVGASGSTTQ